MEAVVADRKPATLPKQFSQPLFQLQAMGADVKALDLTIEQVRARGQNFQFLSLYVQIEQIDVIELGEDIPNVHLPDGDRLPAGSVGYDGLSAIDLGRIHGRIGRLFVGFADGLSIPTARGVGPEVVRHANVEVDRAILVGNRAIIDRRLFGANAVVLQVSV